MLRKKSTASIDNLNPKLLEFITDMSNQFDGIVISSGNDSIHMPGSRHYIDKAIDIGANSSDREQYKAFKAYVLGNDALKANYNIEDIIDEGDHIHIECFSTDIEQAAAKKKQFNYLLLGGTFLAGISLSIYLYIRFKKSSN